tara:strand:+ start:336 stop:1073 length:738 start_codon:yes stop_codon:yes gene_type:complete
LDLCLETVFEVLEVHKLKIFHTPRDRKEDCRLGYGNMVRKCIIILLWLGDEFMALYGYWRCLTSLEDKERQVFALREKGVPQENIYGDEVTATSNFVDREELSKCLDLLQPDDLLILEDITRLGRTMVIMLVEVNNLIERGVFIKTLDGRLDTSLMNEEIVRLIVGVMGYAAECELRNIQHRTSEGRSVAKSRGVKFGAKRKYDQRQIAEIMKKRKAGEGYGTIAKSLGMKKSTVQTIIQREVAA